MYSNFKVYHIALTVLGTISQIVTLEVRWKNSIGKVLWYDAKDWSQTLVHHFFVYVQLTTY